MLFLEDIIKKLEDEEMNLKSIMKKGAVIAALSLG